MESVCRQPGLTAGKRLQVEETLHYYVNGIAHDSPHTLNLDGAYTYDNEGKMTSVNYPTTWSWNGSQLVSAAGPTYTYSFDAMDRPTGLKDQNNTTAVSGVSYNPANQLLGITYFGTVESRQYNNMNQMTNLAVGSDTITYTFPAGTNNGKISQQSDSVSGETVTYQYDSLNRLQSAMSNQGWSETYGFDGFGNLLSKTPTGGAPTLSQAVDATTNRVVGQTYDANGNQTSGGYGYDAENRLVSGTGLQYAYDSRNKRIWKATLSGGNLTQEVYFYGVDGQKLGTYGFTLQLSNGTPVMTDNSPTLAVFFGGKRIKLGNSTFTQDRLGSAGSFKFYPYGEARGTAPADTVGFATYTRDSATGLDYADQRYYVSNFGRFMSADPFKANVGGPGDPEDPASWNRYVYVGGDPINHSDPSGECGDPENPCPDGNPPDPGPGPGPGCDPSRQRSKGPLDPCHPVGGWGGKQDPNSARLDYVESLVRRALSSPGCAQTMFGKAPGTIGYVVGAGGVPIPLPAPSADAVFNSIAAGGIYGQIVFGPTANPQANANTTASLSSITVTTNPLGLAFTYDTITINNTTDPKFKGSEMWNFDLSSFDNALTLMHEMGHVLRNMGWTGGVFNNDDGNPFISGMNDTFLKVDCGSYLH